MLSLESSVHLSNTYMITYVLSNRRGAVYRPSPRSLTTDVITVAYRPRPPYWQAYIIQTTNIMQTRVPEFEARQTRKPGFEKYPPGLHSLLISNYKLLKLQTTATFFAQSTQFVQK